MPVEENRLVVCHSTYESSFTNSLEAIDNSSRFKAFLRDVSVAIYECSKAQEKEQERIFSVSQLVQFSSNQVPTWSLLLSLLELYSLISDIIISFLTS